MHSFIYTQPDGTQQTFNGVTKEDARDQAQLAFFTDYRAGLWQGLRTDGCITEAVAKSETIHIPKDEPKQDDVSTMSMDDIDALLDTSSVDDFMDAVCNDDPPVTEQVVDDMESQYEQTNDAMDSLSEDMNSIDIANATTSRLEIAMSEDPQVREDTPVFQGGWGSGANGVSNHGDKRTVNAIEVSEVAVERQQKHDAWLADLGLSRPTKNISITKAGYKRGTTVVDLGYDNLSAARAVWDEKPDAYTAARQFMSIIESEDRMSVDLPLSGLQMRDDGMLLTSQGSFRLEEHGLKQLLAASRFGVGEDMSSADALFPRGFHTMKSLDPDVRAYVFNEHMRRHCSHDKVMKFRTRLNDGARSIFGVVGTGYQEYDADKVANMIQLAVDDMPYKAEIQYNSETTNFTMALTMHAPADLTDFSAGDLYEVGFRFKANDRGGGSINGSAIAFWNECLNMIILHSKKNEIMRAIHKGNMQQKMEAIRKGMQDARPAMERFAQDWGILGQTASMDVISAKDTDDYATGSDNASQVLIKKLVAEGKVASGIGRDAAVQMMFDSYADQGGGDSVQDVINAITRMAHQHLVDDCARDVLEREAGLLVPALVAQA